MSDRPLISLCLICRDEKPNVRPLLDSCWPWVDEVCVADTGSKDGTVAEFRRYAKAKGQPGKLKVTRFTGCNDEDGNIFDFAKARQAADDLATGEWIAWADMDDTVIGLEQLREDAAGAPAEVQAFFVRYRYAQDADGNPISELWRERLVRNDGTRWQGRLHEHKLIEKGTIVRVDPDRAEWVHRRDHSVRTGDRNIRILESWLEAEPQEPRVLHSLAMEYMGAERHQDAADMYERYLAHAGAEPPDRRAQATRHLCMMLMILGRAGEAKARALQSLAETWGWADTHLTLAEAEQTLGRPDLGYHHAETAMRLGKPDTLLIINPLQYTAHPHALMAVCLAQTGRFEGAVAHAEQALAIAPSYHLASEYIGLFRAQLHKHNTIGAFLSCVDVLVQAGELYKARDVLNSVPFYVAAEGRIVERRAQVAQLIALRLEQPPEIADAQADELVARYAGAIAVEDCGGVSESTLNL